MSKQVTVKIPGTAYHAIADGGFATDYPEEWRRIAAGTTSRRVGRNGAVYAVTARPDDLVQMAISLANTFDVISKESTSAERSALRKAVDRIAEATGEEIWQRY